jgi:hypothetical protein
MSEPRTATEAVADYSRRVRILDAMSVRGVRGWSQPGEQTMAVPLRSLEQLLGLPARPAFEKEQESCAFELLEDEES